MANEKAKQTVKPEPELDDRIIRRRDELRGMLCDMGKRMLDLAETLGTSGAPMNAEQKALARYASLPTVESILMDIKIRFVAGADLTDEMRALLLYTDF